MPHTPRDLYNSLTKQGLLSISYEKFREKWDTPGWSIGFHETLMKKKLTKKSYEDFRYTFSDPDPQWEADVRDFNAEKGIDIPNLSPENDTETTEPQADLGDAKKEKTGPYTPAEPVDNTPIDTRGVSTLEDSSSGSPRVDFTKNAAAIQSLYAGQPTEGELLTDDDVETTIKYAKDLQEKGAALRKKQATAARIQEYEFAYPDEADREAAMRNAGAIFDEEGTVTQFGEEKPKHWKELVSNAWAVNLPLQLQGAWESTKALAASSIKDLKESGVPQWALRFTGAPKSTVKGTLEENQAEVIEHLQKTMQLKLENKDAGSIVDGLYHKDGTQLVGGLSSAMSSVLATAVPAMLTQGATLAPQVIAPAWTDYNTQLAVAKYGDYPNPVAKLVEEGETEYAVPLAFGVAEYGLEKIGLKGLTRYMFTKELAKKPLMAFMLANNKEGVTEYLQVGMQSAREAIANGKKGQEVYDAVFEGMFSEEGIESYLQGFFGGIGMTTPAALSKALRRNRSTDVVEEGARRIMQLTEEKAAATSDLEKQAIQSKIDGVNAALKAIIQEDQRVALHLTPQDIKKIEAAVKKQDKASKDLAQLEAERAAGEITESGYNTALAWINSEMATAQQTITDIKANVDEDFINQDIQNLRNQVDQLEDGTEVIIVEDRKDVDRKLSGRLNDKALDKEKQNPEVGFITTDNSTGNDIIVINKDVAKEQGRTETGRHEFLHKVVDKAIAANPNIAKQLGDKIDALLKEKLGDKYDESTYKSRRQDYKDGAKKQTDTFKRTAEAKRAQLKAAGQLTPELDKTIDDAIARNTAKLESVLLGEEAMTVLAEALATGDIKLSETSVNPVKKFLNKLFGKVGAADLNLESAEDVVKFIQEYNKKFDNNTKIALQKPGAKGVKQMKNSLNTKADVEWKPTYVYDHLSREELEALQNIGVDVYGADKYGLRVDVQVNDMEYTISLMNLHNEGAYSEGVKFMATESGMGINTDFDKTIQIDFYDQNMESTTTGSQGMSAIKVFSKVGDMLIKAVQQFDKNQVIFQSSTGGKRGASRRRLYSTLAKKLADVLGWNASMDIATGDFIVYDPKPSTAGIKAPTAYDEETGELMSSPPEDIFNYTPVKSSMKESKLSLYERTDKIYDETAKIDMNTASFMIAMEWENQVKSKVQKYRNLPDFQQNKEDLVANVLYGGSQSVAGLVKSYKPGTKTEDGDSNVSLSGYINKYLDAKIQYQLPKVGIGKSMEEGAYSVDATEAKGLTDSTETDAILEQQEELAEEQAAKITLADELELAKNSPETLAYLVERIGRNTALNITEFVKPRSKNAEEALFRKALRQGIKADEKVFNTFFEYMKQFGLPNFFAQYKDVILKTIPTTDLSKNPFLRRVIAKKIKPIKGDAPGRYILPTEQNGKWDWRDEDGNIISERNFGKGNISGKYKLERASGSGITSGPVISKRDTKAIATLPTNEFVDYFFKDGAARSKPKPMVKDFAATLSAEVAMEEFSKQLNAGDGPMYDAFKNRMELTSELSPEALQQAESNGMVVRKGIAGELTDQAINEAINDLAGGRFKASKVNKTGFHWFDQPRIDVTNYLKGVEGESTRRGLLEGSVESPQFTELRDTMKQAYDLYLQMLENNDQWVDITANYAKAFQDKNFTDFDAFMEDLMNQANNTIDGVLGLEPGTTSFDAKNNTRKRIARDQGVVRYANDILNVATDKSAALADIINTLVGAVAGPVNSGLYLNTPGFYKDFVQPMIKLHGINPKDFSLVEVKDGTTILHKGKKITTDFSKGIYSPDVFGTIQEIQGGVGQVKNYIDVKARKEEAQRAKSHYVQYLDWLYDNREILSPATMGMVLKGMSYRARSVQQVMHPVTGSMMMNGGAEFKVVPNVPPKYMTLASLKYVLTGNGKQDLLQLIDEGISVVLPKAYAGVVDQFHHSTPIDPSFQSPQVVAKLNEMNLPPMEIVPLEGSAMLPVVDLEGSQQIKESKISNAVKNSAPNQPRRPISVWDFDDTLATSTSRVKFTDALGEEFYMTPAEFAEQGQELIDNGYTPDFSEFSEVRNGKPGPKFEAAKEFIEEHGNEHLHIVTARPTDSAKSIYSFLQGLGLDVKLENITALQNSDHQAKADWITGKIADGYNEFYFVDDSLENVAAVKKTLEEAGLAGTTELTGEGKVVSLLEAFEMILEKATKGAVKPGEKVAVGDATRAGALIDRSFKGRARFFVPPQAEDFVGLIYRFLGKGKQGNLDMEFFRDALIDPYLRAVAALNKMNAAVARSYKNLRRQHKGAQRRMTKAVPGTDGRYNYDHAIRYYLEQMRKNNAEQNSAEDISNNDPLGPDENGENAVVGPKDGMAMMKAVLSDKEMLAYANAVVKAARVKDGYVKPNRDKWVYGSIATDFKSLITDDHRAKLLDEWSSNADEIFNPSTLNKIESRYGTKFRKALENSIARMKTGRKNLGRQDEAASMLTKWVNAAIAPIMFLNQRSGVIQLLSMTNYINWTDNNPLKVAKQFANLPKFIKTAKDIFNSDMMQERRSGLRYSVEDAELANIGGMDSAWERFKKGVIRVGYMPTQIADSFAISVGGASFYNNRLDTYKKQGMSEKQAQQEAWKDFEEVTRESQQSSDQMLTSQEQAGGLSRFVLAFSNTPAQYTRLVKKAALDLKNGRGDMKTNISKIIYYAGIQNFTFAALQNLLFWSWFMDDEDEIEEKSEEELAMMTTAERTKYLKEYNKQQDKQEEKEWRTINSMMDTFLRGMGFRGAVVAAVKNAAKEAEKQSKKNLPDWDAVVMQMISLSPPLGAKAREVQKIFKNEQYNKDVIDARGWDWNSPRWKTVGLATQSVTNVPLVNYAWEKAEAIDMIMTEDLENLEYLAYALGWSEYDLGLENSEYNRIKAEAKQVRKDAATQRRKDAREHDKMVKAAKLNNLEGKALEAYKKKLAEDKKKRSEAAKKAAATRKAKAKQAKISEWERVEQEIAKRRAKKQ